MAAEIEMKNRKDVVFLYYLLIRDRMAEKPEKTYGSNKTSKFLSLLQGDILFRDLVSTDDDKYGTMILHPYDKPQYFVQCPIGDARPIGEEETKLLLAIPTMGDRFRVFNDKSLLKMGKKMTIGCLVNVTIRSPKGAKNEVRGTIRYKGHLPKESGTWFGVELEMAGRGTTNGLYRGETFFKCQTDCGVFVSLDKLRPYSDKMETKNEHKTDKKEVNAADEGSGGIITKFKKLAGDVTNYVLGDEDSSSEKQKKSNQSSVNKYGHQIDDRVWIFINDKLLAGRVRYIGRPPGGKETLAGIELDFPKGKGNGEYYGTQLFVCEKSRAHFTPISNVISVDKFQELYEQPDDNSAASKNNKSVAPKTSEDIVDMESRFSNQPKDQVIKEQEKLLNAFKKEEQKNEQVKRNFDYSGSNTNEHQRNESQSKTNNHISHATIEVNKPYTGDSRNSTPRTHSQMSTILSKNELGVDSMVEVLSRYQQPRYGLIRWLGFITGDDNQVAGLELEEEMDACSDGTFNGKRYFTCPPRRGFFVHLRNCLPDSRFLGNSMENHVNKRLTGTDFGPFKSPNIPDDQFIPPPQSLDIYLQKEARGIQGHHNSCYLDATLFAAFAFSSVMDSILLRPRNENDINDYEKVQTVLRNNIIYPLRHNGFVRADRVFELRELLDRLGTVTGLVGEEKDPEEFLSTLFRQVLKTEPFLKIKSGNEVHNEYLYQVLAAKDAERVLPSVEEILKRSFHQNNLKLAEVPSCLIVQMPRFGKQYKMYERILPSLTINIGELVDNAPQDCAVCGRLAKHHCKECFSITGFEDNDSTGNFCSDCNKRQHSHVKRRNHKCIPLNMSRDICQTYANRPVEHRDMELFAIICIETSHYVTFAKCQEPNGEEKWCFFDSMADRVGTKNGYNVPSVTECPEVIEWLSSEKQNRERIINADDKDLPDRVRRILGDAYVCLYESKEMSMYK